MGEKGVSLPLEGPLGLHPIAPIPASDSTVSSQSDISTANSPISNTDNVTEIPAVVVTPSEDIPESRYEEAASLYEGDSETDDEGEDESDRERMKSLKPLKRELPYNQLKVTLFPDA